MRFLERIMWVVLLTAFMVLEVAAIKRNDEENRKAQAELNAEFQSIAGGLETSIKSGKAQYASTIEHVNGVAATTQTVASLAKQNLENLTGGNSFGYIIPDTAIPNPTPPNFTDNVAFSMKVKNGGGQILSGVTIAVARYTAENETEIALNDTVEVGVLPPHGALMVPRRNFSPMVPGYKDTNGSVVYNVKIAAQNGITNEDIWFRRSSGGAGWDYKLIASTRFNGKGKYVILENIDWTRPIKLP
jgi:hypothetical protein